MKRIQCFAIVCAVALIFTLGAAAAEDMTMERFMQANTVEALLKNHTSVALLQQIDQGESAVWVNQQYRYTAQRQDSTVREGDAEYLADASHCLALMYLRLQNGVGAVPFVLLDAGVDDKGVYYDVTAGKSTDLLYDPEVTAKEEIQSVKEANGVITMTTRLSGQDFIDAWGSGFPEGSYCELVYTLDSQTLELKNDAETAMDPSGRPIKENPYYQLFNTGNLQSKQQVVYDAPMPSEAQRMVGFLEEYLAAEGEDARTVTFILYAGTEKETRLSITGKKGYGVLLSTGSLDHDLFVDEAMVQRAPADDLDSDRTLYVRLDEPDKRDEI